jgi:hypothetical protein
MAMIYLGNGRIDVKVKGVSAQAVFGRARDKHPYLYDPDRPHLDPNQLWEEVKNLPITEIQHNCPYCHKDIETLDMFLAHLVPCATKWNRPRPKIWRGNNVN